MKQFLLGFIVFVLPSLCYAQMELYGVDLFNSDINGEQVLEDHRHFDEVKLRYDSLSVWHEFLVNESSLEDFMATVAYLKIKFGESHREPSAWDKFVRWGWVSEDTLYEWGLVEPSLNWTTKTPAGKVLIAAEWSEDNGTRILSMGWLPDHERY